MSSPIRVFASIGAGACAVALLSGCSDQVPADTLAGVRLWIPDGAQRAFPLFAGADLPRPVGERVAGGQREVMTVIDEPTTTTSVVAWPAFERRARVDQAVLAKTADGHFFSARYEWSNDPLLEGCGENRSLCSKFVEPRALDVDEAKDMLRHASQFTPDLFEKFFGAAPAREGRA